LFIYWFSQSFKVPNLNCIHKGYKVKRLLLKTKKNRELRYLYVFLISPYFFIPRQEEGHGSFILRCTMNLLFVKTILNINMQELTLSTSLRCYRCYKGKSHKHFSSVIIHLHKKKVSNSIYGDIIWNRIADISIKISIYKVWSGAGFDEVS